MLVKTLIFSGLLAVTLGFTLPEGQFEILESDLRYRDTPAALDDAVVLIRHVRSPQRRLEGRTTHSDRFGTSSSVDYNHPINKNWDAYAGASRNFKYNDNSGHAGLRFKF